MGAPRGELFLLPRLKLALAHAGHTHEWPDVLARIRDGRAQYWESQDGRGCLVTELQTFPNLTAINYWLAAGELKSCLSLVPGIEAWAMQNGVTRATGLGRPGFSKILGDIGVTVIGVGYRKELVK